VLTPKTASDLGRLMRQTVLDGTGTKTFQPPSPALAGIGVAGKTGSLSAGAGEEWRHHTWFVGYAPTDKPEVAVAALAVNGLQWKVKAAPMAREALAAWFGRNGKPPANAPTKPTTPKTPKGPAR
jgi:cell division protein FtsI/penicillin-binding protein 2